MASPQLDEGSVKIAYSLWVALYQYNIPALEFRILMVVISLTYGAGKVKAEIGLDTIRYQLGGQVVVKPDRAKKALENLINQNVIYRQRINNFRQILGVQKDFDKWIKYSLKSDKMSRQENSTSNSINTIALARADKMSDAQRAFNYVQGKSELKVKDARQKATEQRAARHLLTQAIALRRNETEGMQLLKDYLDIELLENEWRQAHVKMKFTFALSRFEQWAKTIPRKPRSVSEDEQLLGKRFRYNTQTKTWEEA